MSDLMARMGHTMDRWDVEEPREDWWSYQKEFAEAAAEIERLREVLQRIANSNATDMETLHPDSCSRVAREALKGKS